MNYSRYEEAPDSLQKMINFMKNKKFPSIKGAKIKALLDSKPKKTKGKYRLAELRLSDEFIKFFSGILEDSPYDYVMIFDKALLGEIENSDKKRIIFHELNHGFKDDNDKYKIIPHDFEGFYSEIEYNKDDPEWAIRLGNQMEILHDNA
jgi:hypothetical protein